MLAFDVFSIIKHSKILFLVFLRSVVCKISKFKVIGDENINSVTNLFRNYDVTSKSMTRFNLDYYSLYVKLWAKFVLIFSYSFSRTFVNPIQIVTQDSEFRSSIFKNLAILTNSLFALFTHFKKKGYELRGVAC